MGTYVVVSTATERVWRSADGRELSFDEMDTSHIYACIAKIGRNKVWRQEYLEPLKREVIIREMTTKIYNRVATTMLGCRPTTKGASLKTWQQAVSGLAHTFKQDNPRFKFAVFYKACGYDDAVAAGMLVDIA